MSSYLDLLVWQKSFQLAIEAYKVTQKLPDSEKFGLKSQIQRSVISIPSNIAKGQQRNSKKEFSQFISIARGYATELSTQLQLAKNIYEIDTDLLVSNTEEVQKMLYSLKSKL